MAVTLRDKLTSFGVIPVIMIDRAEDAVPMARALTDGGLPVAEITFRTAAAAEAIDLIKKALPEMLVGAGTILNEAQLDQAQAAGADFMVAPGLNGVLVQKARDQNIPFIPGCVTASEIEQAMGLDLDLVKFFPAEASNAQAVIKAFNGPYPQMSYMPTGGISLDNLASYLTTPNVICCGGSWIAPAQVIAAGDFDQIRENAAATVARVTEIRESM